MSEKEVPTGHPKKKSPNLSRSFLNTTNPEIFLIKPRAGLYQCRRKLFSGETLDDTVPVEDDIKPLAQSSVIMEGKPSRDYRIYNTLNESNWTMPSMETSEASQITVEVPTPLEDSIEMLCVAISTVMMLAGNAKDISSTNMEWTKAYFSTIKDDFGHTPPNIQGILNHISYLESQEEGDQLKGNDEEVGGGEIGEDLKDDVSNEGPTENGAENEPEEGGENERKDPNNTVRTSITVKRRSIEPES